MNPSGHNALAVKDNMASGEVRESVVLIFVILVPRVRPLWWLRSVSR